jgi:hypothetical protein
VVLGRALATRTKTQFPWRICIQHRRAPDLVQRVAPTLGVTPHSTCAAWNTFGHSAAISKLASCFDQTSVLISTSRLKQYAAWGHAMSIREKLNLAALAFGFVISVGWTAFLGFALSKTIECLL